MTSKYIVILLITITIPLIVCKLDKRVITTLKDSKNYVRPAIVNGRPAMNGQVPYLVSLKQPMYKVSSDRRLWKNLCGGSIISDFRVLTAAHCFEGNDFYYAKYRNVLRAVAGSLANSVAHTGENYADELGQWRKINNVVIHENFIFPNDDIALVYVDKKWIYTDLVNYIIPASVNIDYSETCQSAGFGRVGHSLSHDIADILLVARIDTQSQRQCSAMWGLDMSTFICTRSALTDVARGDSGGPLACYDTSDPEEVPGRDILVGVVSGKNFDKTTLFTRVSAYHDWMKEKVESGCKLMSCVCVLLLPIINFILLYL